MRSSTAGNSSNIKAAPSEISAQDIFSWLIPRIVESGIAYNDVEGIFSRVTDRKSWVTEWNKLANIYAEMAEEAERKGNDITTARSAYFQASRCNLWAQYPINKNTDEKKKMYYQTVSWYVKSGSYYDPPIEKVEVPFGETVLPAYLWKPSKLQKSPCVVILKAGDVTKEDYHWTAEAFVQRGLACFAMDAPGCGESRLNGLLLDPEKYDEASISAINYLQTRADIDADRIGVWGNCLGGHFAIRLAAIDSRIKACVAGSGHYDPEEIFNLMPFFWTEFMSYISGAKDKADLTYRLKSKLSLEGIPSNITSPLLLFYGADDKFVPPSWAYRIYDEAKGPKDVRVYEGNGHGCHRDMPRILPMMADWLKEKLYYK